MDIKKQCNLVQIVTLMAQCVAQKNRALKGVAKPKAQN